MPKVKRERTVPAASIEGRPDYSVEVGKGVTTYGYDLEPAETHFIAMIIATPSPGSYAFTRAEIPAGTTVELVDALTGNTGITPDAGYDYMVKMFWCSFNQPVLFRITQDAYADVSCEAEIPAHSPPSHNFLVGWLRSQMEPIGVSTKTTLEITNLGASPAIGKCWVAGFQKEGVYRWY